MANLAIWSARFLAAGFLVNVAIAVPNNYLLGIGRVDIAPKYQIAELAGYAGLTWGGAKLWGITGVALASGIRLAAFSAFLFWASFKKGRIDFGAFWKAGPGAAVAALGIFAAGLTLNALAGLSFWGAAPLSAARASVVVVTRKRGGLWRASDAPTGASGRKASTARRPV